MKVELEKSFPLAADKAAAWALLQDLPAVAACMPGAEITEVIDDKRFKGSVRVKLGPALMVFKGDLEIKELDADKLRLRLLAGGQDSKGASSAEMDLTAWITEQDGGCELQGKSVVSINGKAATFGGRMMGPVSNHIISQFGRNFANRVQGGDASLGGAADVGANVGIEKWLTDPGAEQSGGDQPSPAKRPALNVLTMLWRMSLDYLLKPFKRRKNDGA